MKESLLEISLQQAEIELGLLTKDDTYTVAGTVLRVLADTLEITSLPVGGASSEQIVTTPAFLDLSILGNWYRFSAEAGILRIQKIVAEE